jgi:hypothetical protein
MMYRWGAFLFLGAMFVAIAGGNARADWSDDFDGGFDQTWIFADDALNSPPDATDVGIVGNQLHMVYNAGQLGIGNFDGFVSGAVNEVFTDVSVRATVRSLDNSGTTPNVGAGLGNSNNDVFVVARSDGVASSYLLAFDFFNGFVNLVRVDGGALHVYQPDAQNPNPSTTIGVNNALAYIIEIEAVGDVITGRVFNEAGDTLLAEVSVTDNTYASGISGIGAAINEDLVGGGTASFLNAGFDNVSSMTIIPEPASLALIGLGGLMLLRRRRA